jgi:hypothetical protein
MDAKPLPGAFILEAAQYGLKAVSILASFAPSQKSRDLASRISLSACVLSEVGKEVNQNASRFKENFQKIFEHVPIECKEQYEKVIAAVSKASSFIGSVPQEGIVHVPQKPWKRLLSALNMDNEKFEEFQESLNESWLRSLMLQYIVSLVVLQIRAQKYVPIMKQAELQLNICRQEPLSLSDYNNLGRLKKGLGKLLETIRDGKIASVVAFSLVDFTKPANSAQLIEAVESATQESSSRDDASITSSSATVLNSPVQEVPTLKQESVFKESEVKFSEANLDRISIPPPPHPPVFITQPRDEDEYEMYRVQINTHEKERAHTRFRLFGVPGLMNIGRIKTAIVSNVDRVPASIGEIKSFIMREKDDDYTVPPILNDMINISPVISTSIYNLINEKKEKPSYPHRQWNTEFLVNWEWWESKRFGRKQQKTEGYIVILRGRIPTGPYPPFPMRGGPSGAPPLPLPFVDWPGPPPPVPSYGLSSGPPRPPTMRRNSSSRPPLTKIIDLTRNVDVEKEYRVEKKAAAQIELTQHETETVINDFLATFSTLYEGISVEERGAPLRGLNVEDMDELFDYDSDVSSSWGSGSSRSLVDD